MAVLPLRFKDQGELLDIIDILRSQGLSSYISLPQLVVCGDQSAGKSSVLEAISGVAFPTKDNLCTRFATEVVLRRDPESSIHIKIIPDVDRPDDEKEELLRFKVPTATTRELPNLVERAKDAMGLNRNAKAFSKDILRMEISGPDQPHLTLVDLPGLIHAESKSQSAQDVELVASLVRSYMANPRSIVLAVVSAKNDYANQIVTKFARDVDPKGLRTLGIITKPDMLHVGSESEAAYLGLARNEDVHFRLGWHVLRNRDFDTKDSSTEERDDSEQAFFSKGVWQGLRLDSLGVRSLRPRLSDVLKDQIVAELPALIRDIESELADARERLQQLGEARGTAIEQRLYLVRISETFTSLLSSAINGVYDRDFFGDARTEVGFQKRLRAVVQDLSLVYAESMRIEGHYEQIIDDDDDQEQGIDAMKSNASRRYILRSAYLEAVGELMRKTRGRELPGTFNPMIIGDLFLAQSQPWPELLHNYIDHIIAAARTTVELVLSQSADTSTTERLLREIINPALEDCMEQLRVKVEEVLRPHRSGHPVTYNHYFTDTIQKARRDHEKKRQARILHAFFASKPRSSSFPRTFEEVDIGKLLEALNPETEDSMDRFACSEATYCMEAYYKVSMKTLVDNVTVLGVESCLLAGLTNAFTAQVVMRLNDDSVQMIAAENEESVTERTRTQDKLRVVENGLHTLNRYRRYRHREPESIEEASLTHDETSDRSSSRISRATDEGVDEVVPEPHEEGGDDNFLSVVASPGPSPAAVVGLDDFLDDHQSASRKRKSTKKGIKTRLSMFENSIEG